MELFQRVKRICQELAGSETKLAQQLGIDQRKLNGYLNAKSQKNLWEYLPKILQLYPGVSRYWLYLDEGEMGDSTNGKCFSARNCRDRLVGDVLNDALGYRQLDLENVRQAAKISQQDWDGILASAKFPNFQQLQSLYLQFGLNPIFLFGHKTSPFVPLSQLQLIEFLLGIETAYFPSHFDLERWFGCSKEEANDYLIKYSSWWRLVKEKGFKNSYDEDIGEPVLPSEWLAYFCEHIMIRHIPHASELLTGFVNFSHNTLFEENKKLQLERDEALRERKIMFDQYTKMNGNKIQDDVHPYEKAVG